MGSALKKTAHAAEQERPDVAARRLAWLESQPDLDPRRLVFIDETGASTKMARLRGRSKRGQRCRAAVPHGHWKTTTFTAGLRRDGLTAPMLLDGPMNGVAFLAYVEHGPRPGRSWTTLEAAGVPGRSGHHGQLKALLRKAALLTPVSGANSNMQCSSRHRRCACGAHTLRAPSSLEIRRSSVGNRRDFERSFAELKPTPMAQKVAAPEPSPMSVWDCPPAAQTIIALISGTGRMRPAHLRLTAGSSNPELMLITWQPAATR